MKNHVAVFWDGGAQTGMRSGGDFPVSIGSVILHAILKMQRFSI